MYFFNTFYLVYIVNYIGVVRRYNLGSVAPVCLVAVVLFRIVRCSYVYPALAAKFPYGKRKFGGWTEIVKQIYLYAVCRKNVSNYFCKFTAVVANTDISGRSLNATLR